MSRTPEAAQLTQAHQRAQLALRADVMADLTRMWTMFYTGDLDETFRKFASAAEILIRQRHAQSAGLAAAYFERFRAAEGAAGLVAPRVAQAPSAELVEQTLRAAGLSGVKAATRAGKPPAAAGRNGLVKVLGTAARVVLTGGRSTLVESVRADKSARGWQRVTSGSPCPFCAMVASRGPVFKTDRSARFEAHDHCGCTAEPYYEGSRTLATNARLAEQWETAQRQARDAGELQRGTSNDALNAFRRSMGAT